MINETTNAVVNAPTVLTEKTKTIKLIARDALRMELISPRLAEIGRLENEIKHIQEFIKEEQKRFAIANYKIARLNRLDADHPDFDNLKKNQEETAKNATTAIENLNKEIEAINKEIIAEKEGIAYIETGETKVSITRLAEMVDTLITQDAKNSVVSRI